MFKLLIGSCLLIGIQLAAQEPTVPSQLGTAPLSTDTLQSNRLMYGVTSISSFDDNLQDPNTSKAKTNVTQSFQPRALLMIERPTLTSTLSYSPSFSYSRNATYTNNSQAAGADVTRHFTRRLSLHVREAFTFSSNPLQSWQASADLPNPGVLARPNVSTLGADVRSTTNASQADLVYMLDAHTSIGVSGTFTTLKYASIENNAAANSSLEHSRGWSGSGFYSHRLTPRYSFGFQYTAQHLSSRDNFGLFSSLTHRTLGFFTVALRPTISLSLFAGPEISQFDDNVAQVALPVLVHTTHPSFAGGTTLSWQGKHSGIKASFVQIAGDAGLNGGGAVSMRTMNLQMQRQLTGVSAFTLTAMYISNKQLDPLSIRSLTDSTSAGISYSRKLSERISLDLSVLRQQFLGNASPGFGLHNHDIAAGSLSYSLDRPIRR